MELWNISKEYLRKEEISDEEYKELIDLVHRHNDLYYISQDPIITDAEYDYLFDLLIAYEKKKPGKVHPHSPTQKLDDGSNTFSPVTHPIPLLSLQKAYSYEEIFQWYKNLKTHSLIHIEPKFDGLSVELVYERGYLTSASTRGNGTVGEDITANILRLKIPKNLPYMNTIRIRAEVVMPLSSFHKINEQKRKEGEQLFSSARNAASGSLRQLDPEITAKRGLEIYAYDILNFFDIGIHYQSDVARQLHDRGFNTLSFGECTIEDVAEKLVPLRELLPADIEFDGLVCKLNDLDISSQLGSTSHHPRGAIAYKFPATLYTTKIMSVSRGMGKGGILTPVARVSPVNMNGVMVSSVSLHNIDFIKEKDIKIDDIVSIVRSGDVIPYISGVEHSHRTGNEIEIDIPSVCPYCGFTLFLDTFLWCPNKKCPEKLFFQLLFFVSKEGVNIEGLGDKILRQLIEVGVVTDICSLYQLSDHVSTLTKLPGFATKRTQELIAQINTSLKQPLHVLLGALSIKGFGRNMAKLVLKNLTFSNREQFLEKITDKDLLDSIKGVGPKTVENLLLYFGDEENREMLAFLEKKGFVFSHSPAHEKKGPIFAITGSFPLPRHRIVSAITAMGGVVDNLTSQTDYLILGDGPSSKLEKARERNIPVISLHDLSRLGVILPKQEEDLSLF